VRGLTALPPGSRNLRPLQLVRAAAASRPGVESDIIGACQAADGWYTVERACGVLSLVLLCQVAAAEGHLHSTEAREALDKGQDELLQWFKEQMFSPAYTRYDPCTLRCQWCHTRA
jgi:hypothetical protein